MTGEEMERAVAFVLEQQAQLTTSMGRLTERVDRLTEKIDGLADKVDRNADGISALLAITEIQAGEIRDLTEITRTLAERQRESEERGRRTDERLNALINLVERHVSEGRNGNV